jgi:hypothetical protein
MNFAQNDLAKTGCRSYFGARFSGFHPPMRG